MTLQLDPLFTNGSVLQREKPASIWGVAEPGQKVTASLQGQTASALAGPDGCWHCAFAPLRASEVEELVVSTTEESITLTDVAVGEVFIAGGQSNMEFWMRYDRDVESVRSGCANPRIRFYDVPKCSYSGQLEDFDFSHVGVWRKARQKTSIASLPLGIISPVC